MKITYIIKRLAVYIKKYRRILITDLICAALATALNIISPMIVRYITNAGVSETSKLTPSLILQITAVYLILCAVSAVANFYMSYRGNVMGAKVENDMRFDLFKHLQELSYSFYAENKIGQIMARLTSDLTDIAAFIHTAPEQLFISGITMIVSFVILIRINIPLTLVVFASLPLVFISTKYFNKRMRSKMKSQRVQLGEINSQIEDTLLGIRLVKSFTNEVAEINKFEGRNNRYLNIKSKTFLYLAGFQCSISSLGGILYIAVVVLGAVFIMNNRINAGDYAAYLLYISTLWASIRTLANFTEQFQRGITGIERFVEIMDTKAEITDKKYTLPLNPYDESIEFENVSFRYKGADKNVLENISFKINKGDNIAFAGPSGGGKTTLINLIPRFYDVTDGSIKLCGTDIRDLKICSIRRAIGIVQQDVYLFSGTVFDNIVYGRLDASKEEVISAAKQAGAHDFIMELENGYDTYIGEHGVKLSGGQKQRISIARVFLKNPPILILDEATSALDNESERLIQESLEHLSKGRTVITIAHRLTTIRNADKIMVLTKNGIEESGTHTELMDKRGIYYNMYMVSRRDEI